MKPTNYLRYLLPLLLSAACLCKADTPAEILKRARSGDRIAMRQIGHRLIRGDGVPREVSSGIGWLEKAAGEGDDVAMLMLGDIYRNGIGVSKNMRKAIRYYEKAEEAGNEVAVKRLEKYRPDAKDRRVVKRAERGHSAERSTAAAGAEGKGARVRTAGGKRDDDEAESEVIADLIAELELETQQEKEEEEKKKAAGGNGAESGSVNRGGNQKTAERLTPAQREAREKLAAQGIREYEYSRRAVGAAENGDLALLQLLLDAGVPLNVRGSAGLLHAAVKGGQTKTVAYLISKGVRVYTTDASGQTPLHVAAAHGKADVLEQLLKAGANVGVVDSQGYTPLHAAVSGGQSDVVKLLLKAGASLEAVSRGGETPLHLAVAAGDAGMVKFLLSAGAQVNPKNGEYEKSLLEAAADHKHWDVYKILRQAGAKN